MSGTETPINTTALTRIIILVAVVILVGSGWFWWHNVRMNANNVFWGMINNNLSTASMTRHVVQTYANKSVEQYIRIQFGALNASESTVTLKQTDATGQSVIKSDTIGTPQNDYSRYISISTPEKTAKGKLINTANVIGLWGKSADSKPGQPPTAQYFQQSVLTIVPFGNFSRQQKQKLIDLMHSRKIYDYSAGQVKSAKENGRPVFVFSVKIAAASYVAMMQQYAKELGLGDVGLDPSAYASSAPLSAELTVDKLSRQLVKINYPSASQSETLVDQNLDQPISLPQKTIPISQLQDRIQKLAQ